MTRQPAFTLVALFVLTTVVGCSQKPATDPPPAKSVADPPAARPPAEARPPADVSKAEAVARLRQIGLAMHNHESTFQYLPAGVVGPKGDFGLSWRVQVLPFLDDPAAVELYKQFKLDEAWDSEANKKLVEKMPKVFASPGKPAPAGKTYLRSFVGESAFVRVPPRAPVPKGKGPPPPFPHLRPGMSVPGTRFSDVTDGTSNTLMVVEAAEAVEWTKPDELPAPGFVGGPTPIPVPPLGGVFPGGFHGLMCDGAVHFFRAALKEEVLRAMITTNGGEVLGPEGTTILFPPKPKTLAPPTEVPETLADAAARKTAVGNYRKILLACYDHNDVFGHLPAGVVGPDAAPAKGSGRTKTVGLSWRVQLLPFLGEQKLYEQFKPAEPWDSDHNRKLVEQMPAVFASPGKSAEKGFTFVRTTVGQGGIIRTRPDARGQPVIDIHPDRQPGLPVQGAAITHIPDGTSNTILFVEAATAVPWTKPDELPFAGPGTPVMGKGGRYALPADVKVPALGGVFADGFHAVMADGRVTFYKADYPAVEVAKLLCPNDGWVVEPLGEPEKVLYSVPPAGGTKSTQVPSKKAGPMLKTK